MRRRVIDQDRRSRERKSATSNLDEQNQAQRKPNPYPVFLGWRRGRRGYDGEERHEYVGDGEAVQENAPGFDDAEFGVHEGVDEELH